MIDFKVGGSNIDPRSNTGPGKGPVSGSSGATASGTGTAGAGKNQEGTFADSVKGARRELLDGDLRKIIDQVRTRGDQFLRNPTHATLDFYKDGIKQFLQRAKKELFSLKEENGPKKDGQQKVFQLVETLDADVNALTQETLQKDKSLSLLASLDEIRGLVLNVVI